MIWLLGSLVSAVALAGLAAPWWWPAFSRAGALRRRAANVAAYRIRFAELEADAQAGVLAPEALDAARQELGARLLADSPDGADGAAPLETRPARGLLALVLLALPVFAASWYALAGSWRTQDLLELARTNPELARAQAVDQQIDRLRKRVAANPDDADAWAWLGRNYSDRGSYADAAKAFGRASQLKAGQDPDLLVQEGEALAMAQNRSMEGAPAEKFSQALAIAPDHGRGLWFAGIAAFQAGDRAGAIEHWERLLRQPLPDDTRTTLQHSLAMLRERAGLPPAPAPESAAGPVRLEVTVSLAPELSDAVAPGAALFVYAQDPAGPPMPLAVQRLAAAQLPVTVTLDDSNSMTPDRKLSSVSRWRVLARVSATGNAVPQSGDLEGSLEVGRAGASGPLKVVISRRRP